MISVTLEKSEGDLKKVMLDSGLKVKVLRTARKELHRNIR